MESSPERIDELKPKKYNCNKYQQNTIFRNDLWVKVKNGVKENIQELTLYVNKPNPYKPLEEEVLEDIDKEASVASGKTPEELSIVSD